MMELLGGLSNAPYVHITLFKCLLIEIQKVEHIYPPSTQISSNCMDNKGYPIMPLPACRPNFKMNPRKVQAVTGVLRQSQS